MKSKTSIGNEGEELAADYLERQGYSVIARKYRYKRFEIDLIAKKRNLLVFVEVKMRKNVLFGYPEDFVDYRKVDKIMEAADQYIYENRTDQPIRFDIISIISDKGNIEIKHFKDAFY